MLPQRVHFVALLIVWLITLCSASPARTLQARDGKERRWWIIWTAPNEPIMAPDPPHQLLYNVHTAVYIEGNDVDGPMKIEISDDMDLARRSPPQPPAARYHIRVFDLGVANSGRVLKAKPDQKLYKGGLTTATNTEIFEPEVGQSMKSGGGLATKAWWQDNSYRTGVEHADSINDCNSFTQRLIENLGDKSQIPAEVNDVMKLALRGSQYTEGEGKAFKINLVYHDEAAEDPKNNAQSKYQIMKPDEAHVITTRRIVGWSSSSGGAAAAEEGGFRSMIIDDSRDPTAPISDDRIEVLREVDDPMTTPPPGVEASEGAIEETDGKKATAKSRIDGKMKEIMLVGGNALKALGVAGGIAGAAFVIIDLINKDWKAFGIGVAGLALGVAAAAAFSGPVGWLVGGAIAVLMAILPGAFDKKNRAPDIDDPLQILQWVFFGDKDHTGNEKCREGGDKDCQVVYGPGVLQDRLEGFNNFDSLLFVIAFNEGMSMTLPEIAKMFHINGSDTEDENAKAKVTIDCNNGPGRPQPQGGYSGDNPNYCNHPKFALNRPLFDVPVLNQKGDKVFQRIFPNPGGDCVLVTHPGQEELPQYGISRGGLPSAISCIKGSKPDDVQGTVLDIGTASVTDVSSGNASTDGQAGNIIPAPDRAPFHLLKAEDAICLGFDGKDEKLCLPSGTYGPQTGKLGFSIAKADSMTVPPGGGKWALKANYKIQAGSHTPERDADIDPWDHEVNTKDTLFQTAMKGVGTNHKGSGNIELTGPGGDKDPPSVACLYTEAEYKGDVACFGKGGDDLPDNLKKKTRSVRILGKTNAVYLYVDKYNGLGAVKIAAGDDTGGEDLSKVFYGGDKDTMDQKAVAMWVDVPD